METPNIKLVVPTDDMSLGRMGTVRKDSTKQNLSMIREVLGLSESKKAEPIYKQQPAPQPKADIEVFESDEEEDGFELNTDLLNMVLQQHSSLTQNNPKPLDANLPGGDIQSGFEKDLTELNLTNEVLEYLYNERIGGLPTSFEAYSREVENMVEVARANGVPNDEILNQIKCI